VVDGDPGDGVARLIREQHAAIRALFDEIETGPEGAREERFRRLVDCLARHESAERMLVHPVLRAAGTVGAEIAQVCAREEAEARSMLTAVERAGLDSDEFAPRFLVMRDAVIRHAAREERTVLPLLEQTQDRGVLRRLADALRNASAPVDQVITAG